MKTIELTDDQWEQIESERRIIHSPAPKYQQPRSLDEIQFLQGAARSDDLMRNNAYARIGRLILDIINDYE